MEQRSCPTCGKLMNPATDFFHGKLEKQIIELIQIDHPDWEVQDGVCMRCVEEYRSILASKDIREDLDRLDRMERELVHKIAQRLHLSKNINEVYEEGLTLGERAADLVAQFGGSWIFIFIFALLLVVWMFINTAALVRPFDPYPYILLNLVLSCLAAVQAPIIMMSQNRHTRQLDLLEGLTRSVGMGKEPGKV